MHNLLWVFIALTLFSCSSKYEKEKLLEEMDRSIQYSNTVINASTDQILSSFENKKRVRDTKFIASIWDSIAQSYIVNFKKIINEIKDKNSVERNINWLELKENIVIHKNNFDSLNKNVTKEFKHILDSFYFSKKMDLSIDEVSHLTFKEQKFYLNKLLNQTLILQNNILAYCHSHIYGNIGCGYESISLLVHQNKTHFTKGEKLEIKAGIGSFSTSIQPSVFINHKKMILEYPGYATKMIIVNGTPGKYSIPVTVQFTDQNGATQTKTEDLEYIIDK